MDKIKKKHEHKPPIQLQIISMKHIWMIVAILSLLAGIHKTWKIGLEESYLFFIFAFIAFIMYLIRKNMGTPKKS